MTAQMQKCQRRVGIAILMKGIINFKLTLSIFPDKKKLTATRVLTEYGDHMNC